MTRTREWQQVSVQELLVNRGHTCSNLLSVGQYLGQSKIWCDAKFVSLVKVACSVATKLCFLVHIGMICK